MADNTILQPGQPSASVRTLDRTGTGAPQTEVTQLDLGGPAGNREQLVQGAIPVTIDGAQFDDDGNLSLGINVSADISTATLQSQQLAALQALAAAAPPPQVLPKFTGSIANATDVVGPITLSGAQRVFVLQSGTYTGVTIIYEASIDGTAWVGIRSTRTTTVFLETGPSYTLASNETRSNAVDVTGWVFFRIRATAWASGFVTVVIQPALFSGSTAIPAVATGAAAAGSAIAGAPVLIGGSDGANARAILTDNSGRVSVDLFGNAGTTLDAVITAATAPANALATLLVNQTTAPSLTTGQSVAAQCDYQGSQFVKHLRRGQTAVLASTISATGATTIVNASGSGTVFADLASLVITTTGLAAQTITISDGTLSWIIDYPNAAVAPGQPFAINFDPPLKATTANTAWTANQSLATTCHYLTTAVLQKAS